MEFTRYSCSLIPSTNAIYTNAHAHKYAEGSISICPKCNDADDNKYYTYTPRLDSRHTHTQPAAAVRRTSEHNTHL